MSERTTIGGTVYETVGSSSSNLLLKCNGTARIQWGNKLIDLVKNGKLAVDGSSSQVSIVSSIDEIKKDGIYVLNTETSSQLWVCKSGKQYNITGTDLYISASTKQDITAEQQQQALENLGMYYNTLEDVENAGLTNGIVYVIEDNTLYTIQNGLIQEFEAKLKTVTVEQENEQGEVINSSFQIVLSVLDQEYIILKDNRIVLNHPVYVSDYSQFGSENASETQGYRLYMKGNTSYLDVDVINVRQGIPNQEYIETTYSDLNNQYNSGTLVPHQWYLITDFQNHWKLPKNDKTNNRPILVRALTTSTLYPDSYLYDNRDVVLHYDISFTEGVQTTEGEIITSRGRIVWMKDSHNNEANFDFLDYYDSNGNPLTTLHSSTNGKSIFPKNSYNNKLTVYDLKGILLKDGILDDSNTVEIDFQNTDDLFVMHDNVIECRGLVLTPTCTTFSGNTLTRVGKLQVSSNIINTTVNSWYNVSTDISDVSFSDVEENNIFSTTTLNVDLVSVTAEEIHSSEINQPVTKSTFGKIYNSILNSVINQSTFKDILSCTFNEGIIANVTFNSDINDYTAISEQDCLLYDSSKSKIADYVNGTLYVVNIIDQTFHRGMIVMHSGITPIPLGWAVCDGNSYTYNGVTTTTPNLVNRFIKAVAEVESVGDVVNSDLSENNELTLQENHLPEHNHPHTHEFSGTGTSEVSMTFYALNSATEKKAITTLEGNTPEVSGDVTSGEDITITGEVSIDISGTTSEDSGSVEWENKPIKIEPHYYSLIFIMKL